MSGDEDKNDDVKSHQNDHQNDGSIKKYDDSLDSEVEAATSYIFLQYMAFVTWRPFV